MRVLIAVLAEMLALSSPARADVEGFLGRTAVISVFGLPTTYTRKGDTVHLRFESVNLEPQRFSDYDLDDLEVDCSHQRWRILRIQSFKIGNPKSTMDMDLPGNWIFPTINTMGEKQVNYACAHDFNPRITSTINVTFDEAAIVARSLAKTLPIPRYQHHTRHIKR